jgi:uncharacterized protein (DUF433 family)
MLRHPNSSGQHQPPNRPVSHALINQHPAPPQETDTIKTVMSSIEVNPAICSGKPVIRGTRIMVRNILGMIAGGYSIEKILDCYPELKRNDVTDALAYAAQVIDEDQVVVC